MSNGKLIKNPGEIGRRIIDLEKKTNRLVQAGEPVFAFDIWYGKVTKNNQDGTYNLKEQILNAAENAFEDKDPALEWVKNGNDSQLKEAREINNDDSIPVNTICIITKVSKSGVTNINNWVIIATSASGGTAVVQTDKSNTIDGGKIQFRNDAVFDAGAFGAVNRELGDVSLGPVAYGGNEKPGGSGGEILGVQRHYKFIWDAEVPQAGYLVPMTSAGVTDDIDDFNEINNLPIRFAVRAEGQCIEIYHGVTSDSLFSSNDYKFQVTPSGGTIGTVYGAATSGGSPTIAMEFDRWGHLKKLDGTSGGDTDPPTSVLITQSVGTYPSSGTLYNVSISQTTNLTDETGVDTDDYNGNNAIVYTAQHSSGSTELGIVGGAPDASTATNLSADATDYNGAGTGGNNTNLRWNLARILDGGNVSLTSTLVVNGKNGSADLGPVDTVEIKCAIQTTPIPSATSFDVWGYLEDGAGAQYTRFDGLGEYRIVIFLVYENALADFDPDTPATYIAKQTGTGVVGTLDSNTKSGEALSFNETWADTDAGVQVCALAYLDFFAAAVDPQPLANQTGFCVTINDADRGKDCQAVTGTAFTTTVDIPNDTYSPTSIGSDVTIDGVTYRKISPIVVDYSIQQGGADTDAFSSEGASGTILLRRGVNYIGFSSDGLTNDSSTTELILDNGSGTTDGFQYTINYIETSEISNGDNYVFEVKTAEIADADDTFTFNDVAALPASDDFGGTAPNSGTTADTNFTNRWTETNVGATQAISSNNLVHTISAAAGTDSARSANRFNGGTNPNITSTTWNIYTNMSSLALNENGQEQILEVGNVAGDTFQMGYRYTGGAQELFGSDDGGTTDLFSESSGAGSGKITIERGDFTVSDFGGSTGYSNQKSTGIENTQPFDSRWTKKGDGTRGFSSDIVSVTAGSSATECGYQTLTLTDFSVYTISIDVSNIVDTLSGVGYADVWMVLENTAATQRISVQKGKSTDGFPEHTRFKGTGQTTNRQASTGATSGTYTISSDGVDTVLTFTSNVGTYTHTFSSYAPTLNNIQFFVQKSPVGATCSADFTNFSVVIDGVEHTEKRVLFTEGTALKYAFDDSASNVDQIDLFTETTGSGAFTATYNDITVEAPTGTAFTYNTEDL
jgi:hypothetical protein